MRPERVETRLTTIENRCEVCGRSFKGKRGVAVHKRKTECGRRGQSEQDCSGISPGETVGGPSQVFNHSAGGTHPAGEVKWERKIPILWPCANSEEWGKLDDKLGQVLRIECGGGNVMQRLRKFESICYEWCAEEFGTKTAGTGGVEKVVSGNKSRRQRLLEQLRSEKRSLRKRWRRVCVEEREGLAVFYDTVSRREEGSL